MVGFGGRIGHGISDRHDTPAESRNMLWGFREHIEISGPTPEVKKFPPRLDVENIFRRYWSSWSDPSMYKYFGRNESFPDNFGAREIESHGQLSILQNTVSVHGHIFSRGITRILPLRPELPRVETGLIIFRPESFYSDSKDESTFASDHGITRNISRSFTFFEGESHKNYLPDKSKKLETGDNGENLGVISKIAIELDQFSIKLRFLISLLSILGGLGFAFLSGKYFYEDRRLLGSILVASAAIVGIFGLLLWLAPFPSSWGWWI